MPFFHNGEIEIYFEIGGEAVHSSPPLLFISGTGADLRNKPNQFDSPLASVYRVVSLDQRGLGRTSKPDGDYSMRQYANDALTLIDHLDIQRLKVMGVSFGGMVAQEFAIRHPDRGEKLILACTSAGGRAGSSYPLHELERLSPRERAEKHLTLSDVRLNEQWQQENPEKWESYVQRSLGARRSDRDEIGAMKQLLARKNHDTYKRLANIKCETLIVGGKYDGIAPPKNLVAMNEMIPQSELRFYEGGHMFLIQDKSAYQEIIAWL